MEIPTKILYKTHTTSQRFAELRRYCEEVAHIDPGDFRCEFLADCERGLAEGLALVKGGLAHVGEQYDLSIDGKETRMLFVGFDFGNDCAGLEERRLDIQAYSGIPNPHYKGIIKVMMEVLEQNCETPKDENLWKPFLKRMAQTNATRCCAPRNGRRKTNTTERMRKNCWIHFKKEIEVLRPTIMFFHGAQLKSSFLENLRSERVSCIPLFQDFQEHCQHIIWTTFNDPFESVVLFFSHPQPLWSPHNFGSQWEAEVVPILKRLREVGILPTITTEWRSRQRKDWPSI